MMAAWPMERFRWVLLTAMMFAAAAVMIYFSIRSANNERAAADSAFAFRAHAAPRAMPELAFVNGQGSGRTLADFGGKVVLLNVWATWCVPCREEMPMLDQLQRELGGKDFEVVAVNIDKGGPDKARDFLAETGATNLALYTDPPGKLFSTVKAVGMPTTLLIDRQGREIGRLVGPADWASAEAKRLIEAAIAAPSTGAS